VLNNNEKIPAASESVQKQKNWWTRLIKVLKPEKNNDMLQTNSNMKKKRR